MRAWQLLCVLALMAPGASWSAEGDLPYRTAGFYVGLGGGYGDMELKQAPIDISGGDFGYKIFAGYRFPRAFLPWGINAALEVAWVDLGEVTQAEPDTELALTLDGFTGYVVGYVPITRRFEFVGKAGIIGWDGELAANGTTQDKDDGADLALGIGIGYLTGGPLGFQAELEGYDVLDGALLATVSMTYQFK